MLMAPMWKGCEEVEASFSSKMYLPDGFIRGDNVTYNSLLVHRTLGFRIKTVDRFALHLSPLNFLLVMYLSMLAVFSPVPF
jgi:hypothetical protein